MNIRLAKSAVDTVGKTGQTEGLQHLISQMTPQSLKERMLKECSYICSDEEAFTVYMALGLGKPLLVEGPPGSGKTEVAKVLATLLDAELIRLQCYEGLDEGKALYEWNYQKQILDIQRGGKNDVFGADYLLPRPLLSAIQAEKTPVLLIDEIDKVDPEFEAFLMEILSDFQVSIPEFGTVKAASHPPVILTSNAVRDLGDALRRRCVYLYIDFPTMNREATILMRKVDGLRPALALQIARTMHLLRVELQLLKPPSISESLDLAQSAVNIKLPALEPTFLNTLNSLFLKTREDQESFRKKGGGKWVCKNL
ncbi:Holliday junction ATP-dependent DNA helicase RuvB [Pelotomaculum sp. FP]|uniref:AAA family ATPase n=1 Tax=Pelotomaculum sp. FP TaxID=261474 RepID=UPI001103EA27|nr:MoxR family ATPase [Pelotomaculum sp. FP]TEB14740.1 Holliday junction ATP-dependent DNA helicase RuvB [Pelotomaculum sp. FP]